MDDHSLTLRVYTDFLVLQKEGLSEIGTLWIDSLIVLK